MLEVNPHHIRHIHPPLTLILWMKMFKTTWWNSSVVPNLFRLRHHEQQATHVSCIKQRCDIRHTACADFISQLRHKKLLGPTACAVLDNEAKCATNLFSPGEAGSVGNQGVREIEVVKELTRLPAIAKCYPSSQWDEWLGRLRVLARRLSYQVRTWTCGFARCLY